jgi:site-specific DNA-adenine methylase
MTILDPFANEHSIKNYLKGVKYVSNDIDTDYDTDYHMEAQDFLKQYKDCSVDLVLYDPPYTPRQVSEVYKKINKTVNMEDTQSSYWVKFREEISRVLKPGGICISFGWNTNGIGKNNNMEIIEILLVAHGGNHNDTIATVDKKCYHQERLDI